MATNEPIKNATTSKIEAETVLPTATSDISSSTKTTKSTSKKVENKGIISKIKSFFRMS